MKNIVENFEGIKEYEKEAFFSMCKLVPSSWNETECTYIMDGLRPLISLDKPDAKEMLKIIRDVYDIYEYMYLWYLDTKKFCFTINDIFFDCYGDIHIALHPGEQDFGKMLEDIRAVSKAVGAMYMDKVLSYIEANNPDNRELKKYINQLVIRFL
ncbi:MAG: hypothetical protein MJ145_00200 [Clostridia bacterium]|nr:hypothetical protein [Clostridia bacterium]